MYNKITKELFGFINFEKPTLFKGLKNEIEVRRVKYCYFFPHRVNVWSEQYKVQTIYYFLFWRIIVWNIERRIIK